MARRLIRLDPKTMDYAEVDIIRLKREARELLAYIPQNIDPASDIHRIWNLIVPLCQGVLDNTLNLSVPYSVLPLSHEVREGMLPDDFYRLYAEFKLTISGTARDIQDTIEIDGKLFTYADFEE